MLNKSTLIILLCVITITVMGRWVFIVPFKHDEHELQRQAQAQRARQRLDRRPRVDTQKRSEVVSQMIKNEFNEMRESGDFSETAWERYQTDLEIIEAMEDAAYDLDQRLKEKATPTELAQMASIYGIGEATTHPFDFFTVRWASLNPPLNDKKLWTGVIASALDKYHHNKSMGRAEKVTNRYLLRRYVKPGWNKISNEDKAYLWKRFSEGKNRPSDILQEWRLKPEGHP